VNTDADRLVDGDVFYMKTLIQQISYEHRVEMTAQPKQPDKSKAAACALAVSAVIAAALALGLLWLASGREIVPGVITRPCGPCAVDWYSNYGVLVLACPCQDLIRLRPLPVIQPWFEHGDPRERVA